jgi:hypothetical protein
MEHCAATSNTPPHRRGPVCILGLSPCHTQLVSAGNEIWVVDQGNAKIKRVEIDSSHLTSSVAGSGTVGCFDWIAGQLADYRDITGFARGADGSLYFADKDCA